MFERFRARREKIPAPEFKYDPARHTPVIRASICTGEMVAGFRDRSDGHIEEIMLIAGERDLARFRAQYGITGEIEKIY